MTATANLSLVPSLDEARRLARSYDVVPLYAEFIGDLETPISAVLRFAEEDTVFLLESAESAERFGRYSFLGFAPKRTVSTRSSTPMVCGRSSQGTLSGVWPRSSARRVWPRCPTSLRSWGAPWGTSPTTPCVISNGFPTLQRMISTSPRRTSPLRTP